MNIDEWDVRLLIDAIVKLAQELAQENGNGVLDAGVAVEWALKDLHDESYDAFVRVSEMLVP